MREKKIDKIIHDLFEYANWSYEELGKYFSLPKERIRQRIAIYKELNKKT